MNAASPVAGTVPTIRTAGAPGAPGARAGLFESLKKPWLLSVPDKCALASLLVLFQAAPLVGFALFFKARPDLVPFMDQSALFRLIQMLALIVCAFMGSLMLSLLARSRPRLVPILPYLFCQMFAVGFALVAYEIGPYTSDVQGGVLLTGCIVGLLLFDRHPVLLAIGSALLVIAVTTICEQADLIPYAPLLASSPVQDHHLNGLWAASLGGTIVVIEVIAASILYYFLYRLRDREAELSQVRQLISRYVPAQVVEMIAQGRDGAVDQHARRKLTLFFSDIVGFTEVAERLEPEDLSVILNGYFSEMLCIAQRYDGTVDELSGDAILIFFGAPLATDDVDHALRCVNMATDMQRAVVALNEKWVSLGIEERLSVRMGIDTGLVTVGNFGTEGRMKYAAVGKHVNLAARLQACCTPGRVLIAHSTWLLVRDRVACMPKGEMELKGIPRPVMTYEVGTGAGTLRAVPSTADGLEDASPQVPMPGPALRAG